MTRSAAAGEASELSPENLPLRVLEVLFAVAVRQPVAPKFVAAVSESSAGQALEAIHWLEEQEYVSGGSDARRGYCVTAKGQDVIQRVGGSEERDVSRMLYLWSRQHGSG